MPHIEMPYPKLPEGDPDKDRAKKFTYEKVPGDTVDIKAQAWAMLEKGEAEFLGEGFECIVVALPNDPEKAIAYSFWNPSENFDAARAKTTFYSHRIFSTLFPHNFPKIYAAFGADGENNKGTVRQRIRSAETRAFSEPFEHLRDELHTRGARGAEASKQHPFRNVIDFFEGYLGVDNIYKYLDGNPENIITADDGGEYFVDTVNTFSVGGVGIRSELLERRRLIKEYMEFYGYNASDVEKVDKALDRLQYIEDEKKG